MLKIGLVGAIETTRVIMGFQMIAVISTEVIRIMVFIAI